MSTPRNKINFNIDNRDSQQSVKRRFASEYSEYSEYSTDSADTADESQTSVAENIRQTEKSRNSGNIGNIDILGIFKKSDEDDIDETPVDFTNLNYTDDDLSDIADFNIEDKIENLQLQVEKIGEQFEECENKIKNLQLRLNDSSDSNNSSDAVKLDGAENLPTLNEPNVLDISNISDISGEKGTTENYFFKNTMETVVIEEITTTLKHTSDICKCGKCFHDICAITLNSIPPHYVTTERGELLKKATALLNIENLTKISSEIFKAIDIVRNHPSH